MSYFYETFRQAKYFGRARMHKRPSRTLISKTTLIRVSVTYQIVRNDII